MTRRWHVPAPLRYGATFAAFALLLFLRRPDSLTNAQFFAEDGRVFFHDQLLFGTWEALWTPYAGYLLIVPRLVAFVASFFSVRDAPLIYDLLALAIAGICCGLFSLPAFRCVVRSDVLRLAVCAVMAVGIDSAEMVGTITEIQWYLQLAALLLLLDSATREDARGWLWHAAAALLMLALALSVPMLIIAAPLALWSLARSKRGAWSIPAALILGAAIQTAIYLGAGSARGHSAFAEFGGLFESTAANLAFRGVLSSVIGRPAAISLSAHGTFIPTLVVWSAGLLWLVWLWRRAAAARAAVAVALYLAISSALLCISARDLPRGNQPITFGGERYFYLSACCAVAAIAITLESSPWKRLARLRPAALLLVFSGGIYMNFGVPAFLPLAWNEHAAQVEQWLRDFRGGIPVRPLTVPINSFGWFFTLDGNFLANGGFENAPVYPWLPVGSVSAKPGGAQRSQGQLGLEVSGRGGSVTQLVLGLRPGARMEASAMLLLPCGSLADGALVVEDGRRTPVTTAKPAHIACGQWQRLVTVFEAPRTGRALVKLDYSGSGGKIYWDEVRLDPLVDLLVASWGGIQTVPEGSEISSAPSWATVTPDNGMAVFSANPNTSQRPRYGALSVHGRPFTLLELGIPPISAAGIVQVAVFRPDCAESVPTRPASDALMECAGLAGAPEGQVLMADWTGSGIARLGVFRDGVWYLDLNGNRRWDGPGGGDGVYRFGQAGDIAVTGDWNGDGSSKLGVYRCPPNGACAWVLDKNGNRALDRGDPVYSYGTPGDIPVVSKWKPGDAADHIGVFRNGTWIVDSNGAGIYQPTDAIYHFGLAGDIPVVSHSRGRIGVFRGGTWILDTNGSRAWEPSDVVVPAGRPTDRPLYGEW